MQLLEKKRFLCYNELKFLKYSVTFILQKETFAMQLLPLPKTVKKQEGTLNIEKIQHLAFLGFTESEQTHLLKKAGRVFAKALTISPSPSAFRVIKADLPKQAYALTVSEEGISLKAADIEGAHFAFTTLGQLIDGWEIPCVEITDEPDLSVRGVLLDISRSKVPTLETLKEIADWLEQLKYNHLELYVEGFSFEYRSFPEVLENGNFITVQEYRELEQYCLDRCIDLVPNQNGFGHMSDWLKREEYQDLAEIPEGFFIWGAHRAPSTLNPLDPRSRELVTKMYRDMLPYSKSKYFNMNFDEPYELGQGKSKDYCDKVGRDRVFIEYMESLAEVVRSYDKRPMIWGDVLIHHPESLAHLSKDLIFIDWGYSADYPFYKHLKMLAEAGIDFMAAAGTSTWAVITSRYQDMIGSIRNASLNTIKYRGLGILVTDWGDMGHLQYLPFSYPGFIFGALAGWNFNEAHEYLIAPFLSRMVENALLAQLILDMSTYTRLEGEYRSYGSRLFSAILWAEHSRQEPKDFLTKMASNIIGEKNRLFLKNEFDGFEARLEKIDGLSPVAQTVKGELANALALLKTLLKTNEMLALKKYDMTDDIISELQAFLAKHAELWQKRNKPAGLSESSRRITQLISVLEKLKEGS
jgi:hexosaminidase